MSRRILVLSPHPDDESVGCGGTICRHVKDGDHVHVVFLTSGEGGGHGRTPEETRCVREAEARAAARVLGVSEVAFWRETDGALASSSALEGRLREMVGAYRPDRLYVTGAQEMHEDHRAAAAAVRNVVASAAGALPEILQYEVWTPVGTIDEVVDITPFLDRKLSAIRAHASQCSVLRFDEAAEGLARYRGELYAWPKPTAESGRFAEVFEKLR